MVLEVFTALIFIEEFLNVALCWKDRKNIPIFWRT